MTRIGILILFLNIIILQANSQEDGVISTNRENARKAFTESDYEKALPLFRDLLNSYPKEPEYLFSAAVCIIHLNGDMDEAIRLLRPSYVNNYSRLTPYYLGRAFHLNYAFDDAIKAYSKYLVSFKGGEPGRELVERLIEMARNGSEYTRSGNRVRVQQTEVIPDNHLEPATAINGTGRYMKKPVEFCSKTDIRSGYRPWMFLPSYTEINEYVYTAGYDALKKNGKQLFRIRNINHETWGIPEVLDNVINTPYDEEYPFFDTRTSTLYFSSNGHSSMGGYDIFSSEYNWNTKKWSEPRNLGFPINSPYDDFVYITDGFGSTISFASTRATTPGKVTVYRLKLEKDTSGTTFSTAEEIKRASLLEISVVKTSPERIEMVEAKDSESVEGITDKRTRTDDYNRVLAEALRLQLSADSAARITRDLRIMAKEMPGDSLKKQNVDEILQNDKLAKFLQRQADAKYAEARKLRPGIVPADKDSLIQVKKEVNNIMVYQYRPDTAEKTSTKSQSPSPGAGQEASSMTVSKPMEQFNIQNIPVYSDLNPIPKGLVQDTGLIYRVQLGVFSKPKPNDAFGGISPVGFEQLPGSAVLKYYAGLFYKFNNVSKALESIRSLGFPDAFIVAFYNGKSITVEKAKEIEFAEFKL